jgi:hypothetical protein
MAELSIIQEETPEENFALFMDELSDKNIAQVKEILEGKQSDELFYKRFESISIAKLTQLDIKLKNGEISEKEKSHNFKLFMDRILQALDTFVKSRGDLSTMGFTYRGHDYTKYVNIPTELDTKPFDEWYDFSNGFLKLQRIRLSSFVNKNDVSTEEKYDFARRLQLGIKDFLNDILKDEELLTKSRLPRLGVNEAEDFYLVKEGGNKRKKTKQKRKNKRTKRRK